MYIMYTILMATFHFLLGQLVVPSIVFFHLLFVSAVPGTDQNLSVTV